MGTYVANTDIETLLPGFYRGGSAGSDANGAAMATRMIVKAEALVNGAAATRYSMPFTTIPPDMIRIAQELTCYYLIEATTYQEGKENSATKRFERVFDDVKALREATLVLTYTNGSLVPTKTARMTTNTDYTPIFGLDDPKDWKVDQREIDDQEEARE